MNGVLLIDKPTGMISFELVKQVRKQFQERSVGFLGTLDPLASGLMVLFLGKATKLIKYFDELDKEYVVEMEFGKTSDTYDKTGDVLSGDLEKIPSRETLEEALHTFLGMQWQITPSFSAVKKNGKRAYELARQGEHVNLGKRQVVFHDLEILDYTAPIAKLRVSCSSGTYIRSLVHELGEKIGSGSVMTELRRTMVGNFQVENAVHGKQITEHDVINPIRIIEDEIDWKGYAASDQTRLLSDFS